MDLKAMRALVRQRVKDVKSPYLWSDGVITTLLNEAQQQACRRARLLKDSTGELCRIDLTLNQPLYDVDPRVIFVRRVIMASQSRPLRMRRVRDMDREVPGWESHTGTPAAWVPDYTTGKLRLYRAPDASAFPDYATLTVVRGPLEEMEDPQDEPEIAPRFHFKLHHHACAIMLGDVDAETYDPEAAARHAAEFTAEFGPPSSAIEETWLEENFDYEEDEGVF
jgi:hypothetical protein